MGARGRAEDELLTSKVRDGNNDDFAVAKGSNLPPHAWESKGVVNGSKASDPLD